MFKTIILLLPAVFKKDWLILIADLDLRQTRCKLVIWKPYATDYDTAPYSTAFSCFFQKLMHYLKTAFSEVLVSG